MKEFPWHGGVSFTSGQAFVKPGKDVLVCLDRYRPAPYLLKELWNKIL